MEARKKNFKKNIEKFKIFLKKFKIGSCCPLEKGEKTFGF
jgi:hypothetical protein